MKTFNIYAPEAFGLNGAPDEGESCAVLVEKENGQITERAMLTYIVNDDYLMPPYVDMDSAEPFDLPIDEMEEKKPVLEDVKVSPIGDITLKAMPKAFALTEEQMAILCEPSVLNTENGQYLLDGESSNQIFQKDESLDVMAPVKLNMQKFNQAVGAKYPALLETTHARYGKRYPEFPNAKYFEDKDKTVVFIARSQLKDVPKAALTGECPMFRDWMTDEQWDIKNIYGVCIIEDTQKEYAAVLVSPAKFKQLCNKEKMRLYETER